MTATRATDCPASSAKCLFACAYFATDETEEGGCNEASSRIRKRIGSKMKTKEPAYQWGLKGKKGRRP